jgi:hypothetical protein
MEKLPTDPTQEEKPFSLKEFLSYENPNKGQYENLIRVVAASQSHYDIEDMDEARTNFDFKWRLALRQEQGKELLNYLSQKIGGEILIDLGGSSGSMESVARIVGAKTYITVDKYIAKDSPVDVYANLSTQSKKNASDPDKVMVKADLLEFVSKLPDASVNVTINGIDGLIIPESDYHKALANEIIRVAKNGGVVFGINADSLELLQSEPSMERKDFHAAVPQGIVLEKVS